MDGIPGRMPSVTKNVTEGVRENNQQVCGADHSGSGCPLMALIP